ncbi:MAG: succinate dehydrogenase cytochrome b subunit [Verrucomicrobiales bacterium]|nr:succinate dehydrogenase cytochrome b subunit [Verrucomicrobiales bacterium]
MNVLVRLFGSSVGKKLVMAATGLVLVLFVLGHMIGNLQVFLGPEALNRYAAFLQSNREVLWAVRLVLLTCVGLHVWSALKLSSENRAARPLDYDGRPAPAAATYASRTMLMSGLIVAAFILYHLLHYTVRVEAINFTGKSFLDLKEAAPGGGERHDVFKMVILGFRQPLVSLFYLVGVGLLCLHLSHGLRAMFQSLGLLTHKCGPLIARAAPVVAWILFLGYVSIPLAVLLGFGKEVLH